MRKGKGPQMVDFRLKFPASHKGFQSHLASSSSWAWLELAAELTSPEYHHLAKKRLPIDVIGTLPENL